MSVGAFNAEFFLKSTQSKAPTRRSRFVVDVRSLVFISVTGTSARLAISSQSNSWRSGPEVPPTGFCTLIGYVLHTMIAFPTLVGEIPASDKQPLTVVSRDVTYG